MKDIEGQLNRLLHQQKSEAEMYVSSSASEAVFKAFEQTFIQINGSTLSSSVSGQQISIDFSSLTSLVDRWINELQYFVDDIKLQLNMYDPITYEDINRVTNVRLLVEYDIIGAYAALKAKITEIETDFSNVAIAYKSHMETAFNDMLIFYNNYKDIMGDFSSFTNVSVYVHGIEDDGQKFLSTMPDVSQVGDIVVHETRDGGTAFYVIVKNKDGSLRLSDEYDENSIKQTKAYANADGRIHVVYETEYKNEHRQKTSNNLTKKLIELGLMHGDKNFRLHAHSYGGRRSFQFALDYPMYVKSITTIGTPYDTNTLANIGNKAANVHEVIPGAIGKYPHEYNEYIELDSLAKETSGDPLNDNAYGDMINTSMDEVVGTIKTANPEVYTEFEDIYMTAVVGKQYGLNGDGAVGAKSQRGEVLGDLIDEQPVIRIFKAVIAHSKETDHDKFKEIMSEINNLDLRVE